MCVPLLVMIAAWRVVAAAMTKKKPLEPKVWLTCETKRGRVRIERMLESDFDECVEMCVTVFTTANRVITYLRDQHSGPKEEFDAGFKSYSIHAYRKCLESGLSIVARDESTGKLAAFLFLEKIDVFDTHKPTFLAAVWLYDAAEKLYWKAFHVKKRFYYPLIRNKVLHINTGGTTSDFEGTGVGTALRRFCEAHALAHGCESIAVEPAHPATRHIYEKKLGFAVLATMDLRTYVAADKAHKGQKPWENMESDQSTFALCEKELKRPKWYQKIVPTIVKPIVMVLV
jgi:GNAT superfamily N-acetyltransferase